MIKPHWHKHTYQVDFTPTYYPFLLGSKGIVYNEKKEVLVLWSSELDPAHPKRVDLPGGQVEHGETVFEAGAREVWEETNLEVENIQIIAATSHDDPVIDAGHHVMMFWFLAKYSQGEIKLSWEHDRFTWMPIDKALEQVGWPPPHKEALLKAKEIIADA